MGSQDLPLASSAHSPGRVEDGAHLLRQVSPENVLPAGDTQGSGHGLGVERGFQHQHGAVDAAVGQVVRVLLRVKREGLSARGVTPLDRGATLLDGGGCPIDLCRQLCWPEGAPPQVRMYPQEQGLSLLGTS